MACKCDHVQSATPPGPDSCLAKFEEGAGLGCETRNHRLDHACHGWAQADDGPGPTPSSMDVTVTVPQLRVRVCQ
jgi:hypothetical protein